MAGRVLGAEGFAKADDGDEGTDGCTEDVRTDGGGGEGAARRGDGNDQGDEMEAAKGSGGDTDDHEQDFHTTPFAGAQKCDRGKYLN